MRQGIHSLAAGWEDWRQCLWWCQLKVKPIVRQGLKQEPQSESPLKEDS